MRCKVHSGSPLVKLGRLRSHDQATALRSGRNHVDWNRQAVKNCADTLREAGLVMPTWRVLADTPPTRDLQAEPVEPKFGWQQRAVLTTLWPTFTDAQKELSRGPLASAALTMSPTSRATRIGGCAVASSSLSLCPSRTCRCGRLCPSSRSVFEGRGPEKKRVPSRVCGS